MKRLASVFTACLIFFGAAATQPALTTSFDEKANSTSVAAQLQVKPSTTPQGVADPGLKVKALGTYTGRAPRAAPKATIWTVGYVSPAKAQQSDQLVITADGQTFPLKPANVETGPVTGTAHHYRGYVFLVPLATAQKIAAAKTVTAKIDDIEFAIESPQQLQDLVKALSP